MDAIADLGIGNILNSDLLEIWRSHRLRELRDGFGTNALNKTCAGCDMYRDLEFYRTRAGRLRATMNRARLSGLVQVAPADHLAPFSGG
jgi:hypothetical protein